MTESNQQEKKLIRR